MNIFIHILLVIGVGVLSYLKGYDNGALKWKKVYTFVLSYVSKECRAEASKAMEEDRKKLFGKGGN